MAKAANKTTETKGSVEEFLDAVEDEGKRADCYELLKIMKQITKEKPKMWGPSIVGFGNYTDRYESGREGDWFLAGFSPRKQNLTLYIMSGFSRYEELMKKLGTYKNGKSCLYVKRLDDVDRTVLKDLIKESATHVKETSV